MGNGEKENVNLEMAEALDGMEKTLSSGNADFLEKILKKLRANEDLTDKEATKLEELYEKHLGEDNEDDENEDDIDEDDFV